MNWIFYFFKFPQAVLTSRHPLRLLIERDFKARYIKSSAGLLWPFLNPLLQVAVYGFVFSFIFGRDVQGVPFAVWLFAGLLPWMMLSEILKDSIPLLNKHKNLVTKTNFKPELLPLIVIGTSIVTHIPGLIILFCILQYLGIGIGMSALTLPLYTICLVLFSLGLSWFLSALSVFFQDIGNIINILLQLWFYLCPIVYPPDIIPAKYSALMCLNPMIFIIKGYRNALLFNEGVDFFGLSVFLLFAVIFFIAGNFIFYKLKDSFPEVL